MALDEVNRFTTELQRGDSGLHVEIRSLRGTDDTEADAAIAEIGNRHGYDFTEVEARDFIEGFKHSLRQTESWTMFVNRRREDGNDWLALSMWLRFLANARG